MLEEVLFDGQALTDLYLPICMDRDDYTFIHESQKEGFEFIDEDKLIILTNEDYEKMQAGEDVIKKHFVCRYVEGYLH